MLSTTGSLSSWERVSGTPIPPVPDDFYLYPFLGPIEKKILAHLRSNGFRFNVIVEFSGAGNPFDIIIATRWNNNFRGPLPKVAEGEDERVIREWLEANGDFTGILYLVVTYLVHRHQPERMPVEDLRSLNTYHVWPSLSLLLQRSSSSPRTVSRHPLLFVPHISMVMFWDNGNGHTIRLSTPQIRILNVV